MTAVERFLAKVQHGPIPEHGPQTPCWLWTAYVAPDGYGRFRLGTQTTAHRAAFTLLRGAVPDGMDVDHLCRVHRCVNPDHLEVVSHRDNVRRGLLGGMGRSFTRCPNGHPYAGGNVLRSDRSPRCRTCRRNQNAKRSYDPIKNAEYGRRYRDGLKQRKEHAA